MFQGCSGIVPGCSGLFRWCSGGVPGCSEVFRVCSGFYRHPETPISYTTCSRLVQSLIVSIFWRDKNQFLILLQEFNGTQRLLGLDWVQDGGYWLGCHFTPVGICLECNRYHLGIRNVTVIIVKILSAFRSLFRNDFHYSGTDCIIGIKIPSSNWRLESSNGRLIRNNECWLGCYLHKPKVHARNTKPLAAVGFNRFDITGNFSQFSGTFLVRLQQICF